MKVKKIVDNTTNRSEFNRAYKSYLEHRKNGIHCSYCRYHKGENKTTKHYGGTNKLLYPNWKFVSKNRKQWMKKPIKLKEKLFGGCKEVWIDITW